MYALPDENGCDQIVCKSFFKQTLSVTDGKISLALKRKEQTGTPIADRRGKHPPHNKTKIEDQQFLCDFIKLFPSYESHYSRKDNMNRKYLSPTLNMSIMYREYKKKCLDSSKQPLSLFMFRHIFNTQFNLHFHTPHTDTCQKCDSLNAEIKSTGISEDRKHAASIELELHQRKAEAAKQNKNYDVLKAKASVDKTSTVLVFDLQKTLPTPALTTGVAYYKRQLWTYNLGIHDEVANTGYMYVWSENIASRGPQEIASCLIKHFSQLPNNIQHLILYSDACGGQNRNIKMSLMLNYVLLKSASLKIIDQKFFVSGHSFSSCDQDFGIIEKEKRHHDRVFSPDDWIDVIQKSKKREPKFHVTKMSSEDFFSSKSLERQITNRKISTDGAKIEWLKIHQIRYVKNEPKKIYVRYTMQEDAFFYEVDLNKKARGRPSHTNTRSLDLLYPNGRPITVDKKKDLIILLKYIPPEFHPFYIALVDNAEAADFGLDEEPAEDD